MGLLSCCLQTYNRAVTQSDGPGTDFSAHMHNSWMRLSKVMFSTSVKLVYVNTRSLAGTYQESSLLQLNLIQRQMANAVSVCHADNESPFQWQARPQDEGFIRLILQQGFSSLTCNSKSADQLQTGMHPKLLASPQNHQIAAHQRRD